MEISIWISGVHRIPAAVFNPNCAKLCKLFTVYVFKKPQRRLRNDRYGLFAYEHTHPHTHRIHAAYPQLQR